MARQTRPAVTRELCEQCIGNTKNAQRMVLLMAQMAAAYEKLGNLRHSDEDKKQSEIIISNLESHVIVTTLTLRKLSQRSEQEDLQLLVLYNSTKNAWTRTQYYEIYQLKQFLEEAIISNQDYDILPQAENVLNGFLFNEDYVKNLPALNEDVKLSQWEIFAREVTQINKTYRIQLDHFGNSVQRVMNRAKLNTNYPHIEALNIMLNDLNSY
ncbi:uncharacterized protein KLLA0_E09725g [Kluyveromyces lactis]|uniref:KLLA0E09725p n=1 Tax=Kluyveromyces lactis (strain ATCC 8585 / CBS 2359 / DSM 70799 / NBRC 1267 / NRRL Y-1140 / WM37) TaxID=284590 RepID=Q6CNV1_KLULA|nr:uncharacterized protein KLLA0_E09725g [Kluyveromyces lactis]CAG99475.1 KLLA0E09725p [Kluyveromyces lactis]|eukprot:XP_454388.1 uncharacterized protein KLLA0_E09725g [Kluyveromyces lactis]